MDDKAIWLDYFTSIDIQSNNAIWISHRSSDDELDEEELLTRTKWAWNIGQNEKQYRSEHGLIFEVSVPILLNRHFLVHESKQVRQSSSKVPLLIFFHGLNSSAWFMALVRTKWIEKANINNFLVVFGQSQGKQFRKGPKYNQHGILQFGDDLS
ncbi:unnamed protein product [Rotaria sp. Silwood1]|nr:unnamed protein product [Rotaria sp. Silwood1]CAF1346657.1 unnamed protein product [Rotaria sp. Silwood1]CAF3548033.1 unnamed protein product [Rotaria sp. Silwood1]CAF3569595.1 unnamed protein product [Rotaria sp. Silwood1]CAF4630099.1 unnamed protein product [Rotaria sp. Silwood1]